MKTGSSSFIILGIIDIIISISGIYIWRFLQISDVVLGMTCILLALTTFFGFIAISQSLGKGPTSNMGSMRTAIASGVLVMYFFILAISTFGHYGSTYPLSEFGETMVENFTTVIGIVIPFYFGASAYVQVQTHGKSKKEDQSDTDQ